MNLLKKIIHEIDDARVELGFSVRSNKTGAGYSVDTLSTGAKTLILMYELRDRIFLASMGDNCTDLLEEIAADYEKEGRDLIIVANYMHKFNFRHITSIEYINWGIVCHSWNDICKYVYSKFNKLLSDNIGE